jgi:hypothetical protein
LLLRELDSATMRELLLRPEAMASLLERTL